MYKWNILEDAPKKFYEEHPELPPIITKLLWHRDLKTQIKIDEFLNPDYSQDNYDPFLFNDMSKAIKIIKKAIKKKQRIVVHGDYDVDGVCASTILIKTIKLLGAEDIDVFIPHRETDGYGLNINTIELLSEQKTKLLITCDCGVSNVEEVKLAKKKGMDVIITDHHTVPEKPPKADAIIHPKVPDEKYPDKNLAGAAVAFKLAQGLLKDHKKENELLPDGQPHEGYEKWMLDLVALATIADMVPLIGESRTLAKYGMVVLNKTQNIGLRELLNQSSLTDENGIKKKQLTTQSISFQLVPKINAAGRMDHANTAFALLMTEDHKEAVEIAKQLHQNNLDRQKLTEKIVKEAKAQIEKDQLKNPILFACKEGWSTGILGLVASRLKDQYNKPVIVMGITNNEVTGSGRSIKEINIMEALQEISDFFSKFGGHPQACGLSLNNIEQLEEFKERMIKLITEKSKDIDLVPQIDIDAQIELEEVDWKLFDLLQKFEPFGQRNEEPKYMAKNLTITDITPVGQTQKHLRIMVKHNSHTIRKTIAFGLGDIEKHPEDWKKNLKTGDKVDMVFSIGVNEWNGNRELQLSVIDIKK